MVRAPHCDKSELKKGVWSREEDQKLISHVQRYGHPNWSIVPKLAGLLRCGKNCRLRWVNYLKPGINRGSFTTQEEQVIIEMQRILGNRWSTIAAELPGRTDNDIKNHWRVRLSKRQMINTSMASTDTADEGDKGNSRVDNDLESKSESEAASLTRTDTFVAVLEDGDRDEDNDAGNVSLDSEDDLWADILLELSLTDGKKSGCEGQPMAATPFSDEETIADTWWLDDDDSGLGNKLDE